MTGLSVVSVAERQNVESLEVPRKKTYHTTNRDPLISAWLPLLEVNQIVRNCSIIPNYRETE